jgi:hypothetical protein
MAGLQHLWNTERSFLKKMLKKIPAYKNRQGLVFDSAQTDK